MTYEWVMSASADDEHHDQEVELANGWHACVSPSGDEWVWHLADRWLHTDEDGDVAPIAEGTSPTEAGAKAAAVGIALHFFGIGEKERS